MERLRGGVCAAALRSRPPRRAGLRAALSFVEGAALAMGLVAGCGSTAQVQFVNGAATGAATPHMSDVSRALTQAAQGLLAAQSQDYRIGPGDVLEVTVFEWEVRNKAKTAAFRVSERGSVSLPLLGDLQVADLAVGEVKEAVEKRLRDGGFIREPQVTVDIKAFESKRVAVLGAVNKPGIYTLQRNATTLLEALSMGSGLNERAGYLAYVLGASPRAESGISDFRFPISDWFAKNDKSQIGNHKSAIPLLQSKGIGGQAGNRPIVCIDLNELMEKGNLDLNLPLGHGAVINVPEAGKFAVIGYVGKPGSFPLTRPTTVLEGIALAGGLKAPEASPSACALKRFTPEGERVYPLDLVAISEGKEANLRLQPADVVDVRQSGRKKVFLEAWSTFKSIFNVGYTLAP